MTGWIRVREVPDDDASRPHEVSQSCALSQELRVREYVGCGYAGPLHRTVRRPGGQGAADDQRCPRRKEITELPERVLELGKVTSSVCPDRRADTDHDEVRLAGRHVADSKPTGRHGRAKCLLEASLEYRHLAVTESLESVRSSLDHGHVVTQGREANGCHQADIASAYDQEALRRGIVHVP